MFYHLVIKYFLQIIGLWSSLLMMHAQLIPIHFCDFSTITFSDHVCNCVCICSKTQKLVLCIINRYIVLVVVLKCHKADYPIL